MEVVPVFGIVHKKGLGLVLCLVVVLTMTVSASAASLINIRSINCVTTLNVLTCKFTTNVAVEATLAVGATDRINTVSVTEGRFRLAHSLTIKALAPNTRYFVVLTLTPKIGKPRVVNYKPISTLPPGSVPAVVTSRGNKLLLNGVPWFMSAAYIFNCPDQSTITNDIKMGTSAITGSSCLDRSDPASSIKNLQAWLGKSAFWVEKDGARNPQITELPEVMLWKAPMETEGIFPAPDPCTGGQKSLTSWLAGQLAQIHGSSMNRPVIASTWIAQYLKDGMSNCLTPPWMDAYFWGTVLNSATGIVFDTHQPISQYNVPNFQVGDVMVTTVARENLQLATLQPWVMTGSPNPSVRTLSPGLSVKAMNYGGLTYLLVENSSLNPVIAKIAGLGASVSAQVLWENRSMKLRNGLLIDKFGPLAVHIYKITKK